MSRKWNVTGNKYSQREIVRLTQIFREKGLMLAERMASRIDSRRANVRPDWRNPTPSAQGARLDAGGAAHGGQPRQGPAFAHREPEAGGYAIDPRQGPRVPGR